MKMYHIQSKSKILPLKKQGICSKHLLCIFLCFLYIIIFNLQYPEKLETIFFYQFRSSHRRCSVKKVLLKISQENTCVRVPFSIKLQASACNFIKKQSLVQVFSCKFCHISKNTVFTEHVQTTTSTNSETCFKFQISVKKVLSEV